MAIGTTTDNQGTSTRPYLLRALHDWCTDNGFTPYIAVHVDETVQVPREHVKNNEIVLNVGFEATSGLKLGNEAVEFRARFGGVSRDIVVPVDHVVAIYARENGQGMAFPVPTTDGLRGPVGVPSSGVAASSSSAAPGAVPGPALVRTLRLATEPEEAAVSAAADADSESPVPTSTQPTSVASVPADRAVKPTRAAADKALDPPPDPPPKLPPKGPRPSLKRVK